jgi:hypothetical protein
MITTEEAFARLEFNNVAIQARENDWKPISPVPSDAPKLTEKMLQGFAPNGYEFTDSWRYFDSEGRLLGFAVRFDSSANGHPADKVVKPVTFCLGSDGQRRWRCKGFISPRPLYGLDRLAQRPLARVLVVEGEKTADAAGKRFPDYVVVTSSGGSGAGGQTDWRPLAGRHVTVWPDADGAGARYGEAVAALLLSAGAASVHTVSVPLNFPNGWDLADTPPTGVTDSDLSMLLLKAKPVMVTESPSWPAVMPIISPLPPVEPFIAELLPDAIRDYVLDVADRQQAPPDFAAVTALCGLAAVVGNRIRVRPKQNDDWEVVPNLWGAIIGRPSAMKSPAMQAALSPIYATSISRQARASASGRGIFWSNSRMAASSSKAACQSSSPAKPGRNVDGRRKCFGSTRKGPTNECRNAGDVCREAARPPHAR